MGDTVGSSPLADAVAVITGASSGIGAATALRLAAAGCRTLLVGRDTHRLNAVAAQAGGEPIVADLSSAPAVSDLATRVLDQTGQIDIVVHNAGVGWAGPLVEMPEARLDELVAVNLLAPLHLTRLLLPAMLSRRRGRLVFVTSIAGRVGVRQEGVYAATKAAVDVFADSLRFELAGTGVGVSVVVPGAVRTPFFQRRGTPYGRRWPRPVPAERVAAGIVSAVIDGRDEVFVPGWLVMPVRLRGSVPALYRRLAGRYG